MKALAKTFVLLSLILASSGPALAVDDDFKISGGDVLQVTVWKEEGMDREVLVLPDGTMTFPLIGTVLVADKTPAEAQEIIKKKLQDSIPDAAVTVMVKAPQGHTVSVVGQVTKPGEIVMARRMSAMEALAQAGGLTPFASKGNVFIIRRDGAEKKTIELPYNEIAKGESLDHDIDLNPGDVIFVPTAGLF
jgi:polysaccharide biosynthesis/export protein